MSESWGFLVLGGGLLLLLLFPLGLAFFWWGWRGRPQFSEPFCAKCGYDLRAMDFQDEDRRCPECGADLKARKAVRFGKHRKRPVLIGLGIVLMLPAVLGVSASVVTMVWAWTVSPSSMSPVAAARNSNNQQLVALLATTVDEPWTWQEMERRYDQGNFSSAEVEAAIDQLIQHLNQQSSRQPLHWCDEFLRKVQRNGDLSKSKYGELCEAFYGPAPTVNLRPLVRQGKWVKFSVRYDRSWHLPDIGMLKALREVRYEGEPIEIFSTYRGRDRHHPDYLSGRATSGGVDGEFQVHLPPGEHELVFVIDAGVVANNAPLAGRGGRPGQASRWVNPVHTWTYEVPAKVKVVAEDESTVEVIENHSGRTLSRDMLRVEQALVREERRGVSVNMVLVSEAPPPLPLSYRVSGELADGTVVKLGTFLRKDSDRQQRTLRAHLHEGLAADVTEIDLRFEPDPAPAAETFDVMEIWGRPHTIEGVAVERYDLR